VTAITLALGFALAEDALGFALMGRQVDETGLEGRRSDAEHTKLVDASQPKAPDLAGGRDQSVALALRTRAAAPRHVRTAPRHGDGPPVTPWRRDDSPTVAPTCQIERSNPRPPRSQPLTPVDRRSGHFSSQGTRPAQRMAG